MKNYTIKNYKGNLVESLSKFVKSHKGMRIVEAVEKDDELKIKAEAVKFKPDGKPYDDRYEITTHKLSDLLDAINLALKNCKVNSKDVWFYMYQDGDDGGIPARISSITTEDNTTWQFEVEIDK